MPIIDSLFTFMFLFAKPTMCRNSLFFRQKESKLKVGYFKLKNSRCFQYCPDGQGFILLGIHNVGLYMENILLYIFSWLEYMAGVLSFFKTEKTK